MKNEIVRVTKAFPYSPDGMHVDEYPAGVQRVPAPVAEFAIEQKFAKAATEKEAAELAESEEAAKAAEQAGEAQA